MAELERVNEVIWLNARDSLTHALNHFVELAGTNKEKWHHQKWIILSVHHAACCLAALWLRSADDNHPIFKGEGGKEAFPHLEEMIKALQKYKGTKHLTLAESELLELLNRLNNIRNKFMHRLPPTEINKEVMAYTATSMVGMLHVVERRAGASFHQLFDEFPEIRKYVMEAIHYSKIEEYFSFIERILENQGYQHQLPQCPGCGAHAVVGCHCEACFEDVSEVECPSCHGEFYIQTVYPFEQECPECGYAYKT